MERPSFSAADFFETELAPVKLREELEKVVKFIQHNLRQNKRIILITSGGTTIPLEENVVRFLDNFSAGTRGSSSAEHFLRTGKYAVIFLHRQHSLQPFSRHYSHSTNPFLDLLEIIPPTSCNHGVQGPTATAATAPALDLKGKLFPPVPAVVSSSTPKFPYVSTFPTSTSAASSSTLTPTTTSTETGPQIHIPPPHLHPMLSLLKSYQLVQSLGLLHSIPYTTVSDYLFLLRGVSRVMGSAKDAQGKALGRRGMYYLAAAVSDFFIPRQRMSKHKIQSGKGSLTIEMDQVPKVLKGLVDEWSNDGYIVSFKLETDISLLIPKSRAALERYGHQVVIGNSLLDRKHEVVFVEKTGETWLRIPVEDRGKIGEGGEVYEIEEDIIDKLVTMHDVWIEQDPLN